MVDTGLIVAIVIAVILLVVLVASCYWCNRTKTSSTCTCFKSRSRSVEREEPTYMVSQIMDRNSNYATVT